ncbi:pdxB [Wigglesworthia glossinidia endosymbiont of Glossina brevipalpis]|uniref:Erythronate-4-phosphate dehydrogenase n=1 Tax=Wigglesworthia glossinidia brevipalpis TaxID=36870 RepID=PDXB_WIGBR|nr:RecName: Full=Erythronate-4-phosphate dehydrogenase [Wigglesworthia glossinidia endosymbiont of Glossina brevipalpis]BAC24454.1 pdxB [Wigglesworthia glossinidia endosymbiont of Glossina brevipalpis]
MKILIDNNIIFSYSLFKKIGKVNLINSIDINAKNISGFDALIIKSSTNVNENLLKNSNIKFIGSATSGKDHVDVDWLKKNKINFDFAPGCNSVAVAEYVFSSMLYFAYRDKFSLLKKTVGIVGFGNIGKCLNKKLSAIGVKTILCDPILEEKNNIKLKSLNEIVQNSDIITLHVPLTYSGKYPTWHLINKKILLDLKDNCILINTSRGSVIDNNSLLNILKEGKPIRVVLDVWENEPLICSKLLSLIDIGTPHIAGHSLEGKIKGTISIFNSLCNFVGKKNKKYFISSFIDPYEIEYISMKGRIDQSKIYLLSLLSNNILYDDHELRKNFNKKNCFVNLRNSYRKRREWSSLFIKSNNILFSNLLNKIGFNSKFFKEK